MIRVLLDCCLQEKTYNPYYSILATKLCQNNHNHKYSDFDIILTSLFVFARRGTVCMYGWVDESCMSITAPVPLADWRTSRRLLCPNRG